MARIEGIRTLPFGVLLSLFTFGSTVVPSSVRADASTSADAFEGTFRHVGGSADREALEHAIDEATAGMNFLVRGIARKKLRARLRIPAWQAFHFAGSTLAISSPSGSVSAPADGTATATRNGEGDPLEVSHRFAGGSIHQVVTTEEGRRETAFSMDAKNERLRVDITISADSLPNPIRYRLTYAR